MNNNFFLVFFCFWSESLISSSFCNNNSLIRKWMKEAEETYKEIERNAEKLFLRSINKEIEKKQQRSLPEMSRPGFYSIYQIDRFNNLTRTQ